MKLSNMSRDESYALTKEVFSDALKSHPDLMEHYAIQLDGIVSQEEIQTIMWRGLAATIRARYPNKLADIEADGASAKMQQIK